MSDETGATDNCVPLSALEVTNQSVAVCDLDQWSGPESPVWHIINGSQDEVGQRLAAALRGRDVRRLDDFGGVCETFLCDGEEYRREPPRIAGSAAVFSFTPKKRLAAEGNEMARVSSAAGYRLLVVTLQKHAKFGKVWVLCGTLRHRSGPALTYYEDTNTLIDELKRSAESERIMAVHVWVPGYEDAVAHLADRVVSQIEYQQEVLVHRDAT